MLCSATVARPWQVLITPLEVRGCKPTLAQGYGFINAGRPKVLNTTYLSCQVNNYIANDHKEYSVGGNAIPGARRVQAQEYLTLVQQVNARLEKSLGGVRIAQIPSYRGKPDFGDMDILLESDALPVDWRDRVSEALGSRKVVPNGPVCSFEFDHFQVDLINCLSDRFDFALGYFSWNDLGNLMGRIAHRFQFKFGHEGLLYPVRAGDHLLKEVLVTRDFAHALKLLGFDFNHWAAGFDTLEEIFRFVASSSYFDAGQFPLEHRGHRARVRDAKRPTYMKFVTWVNEHKPLFSRDIPPPETIFEQATSTFPDFLKDLDRVKDELQRQTLFKERFNGRLVQKWTQLDGKLLGTFMAALRSDAGGSNKLQEQVLRMSPDQVQKWVLKRFNRSFVKQK
jgi:hypothetical protein